jgi:dienelactone hydrolase
MVDEYKDIGRDGKPLPKKWRLARDGYIYAVAATLTLQREDKGSQFNFQQPSVLKSVDSLTEDKFNGFQAETFIYDHDGKKEAVIAFRGSDQFIIDYLFQNFAIWQVQNPSARDYVKRVASDPAVKGMDIVVVGNSLGGGLAAHVAYHPETRKFIKSAWVFNPSPRTGVAKPQREDPRMHMLATTQEILGVSERRKIGAFHENRSEEFDLVSSSSIYSHYRWVLARQVLWYADLSYFVESGRKSSSTPPLEILKTQKIDACTPEEMSKIEQRRKAYDDANKKIPLPEVKGAL